MKEPRYASIEAARAAQRRRLAHVRSEEMEEETVFSVPITIEISPLDRLLMRLPIIGKIVKAKYAKRAFEQVRGRDDEAGQLARMLDPFHDHE
jgi:hypothetical protein